MPQYAVGVEPPNVEKKPSRAAAALLALLCTGLGQAYLGQWRRALLWALVPLGAILSVVLLVVLGRTSALFGSLIFALVFLFYGARVGALLDVFALREARFQATPAWRWIAFGALITLAEVSTALTVRTFLMQAFKMPSGSMSPTLRTQDHVMADMLAFHRLPKRGQLAIFKFPGDPSQDFLKRIIALPGDELEMKSSHPWLNGWPVPHCRLGKAKLPDADEWSEGGELEVEFLADQAYLVYLDGARASDANQGPWVVPAEQVYVLGDNRNNSSDSRAWDNGRGAGVPYRLLKGEPLFVWLAFSPGGATVDWKRTGIPLAVPLLGGWVPELEAALAKCLAERPPRSQTEPPPRH